MRNLRCFAALAVILLAGKGLAESPSSSRLQTEIGAAESAFVAVKGDLDSKSSSTVNSLLFDLRNRKSELDRQISEWKSVDSRASSDKSTVDRLRIEWEIAKAEIEQEDRAASNERAELDRQLSNLSGPRAALNVDFADLGRDAAAQKRDAEAYDRDKRAFEGRGGTKEEAEFARLVERCQAVNAMGKRCIDRQAELSRRSTGLSSQDDDLRRRLAAIFNGTRLLEKRLALSTKERDYVMARAALERLLAEHTSRAASINGALASAENAARSLAASLAAIPRDGSEGGVAQRTDYSLPAQAAAPLPADDASSWVKPPHPRQELAARRTFLLPIQPTSGVDTFSGENPKERPFEQLRAGVVRQTLGRYETKPVEAAPAAGASRPFDSTNLVRSDLPLAGFGEFAAAGDSLDALVVDLSKPVDPGAYFSPADYKNATREQARFAALLPKLEAKLAQVKSWRAELHAHQGDLEELRQETVRNNVANCLAIAPPSKVAAQLAKHERYAKFFTSDVVAALERSEKAYEIYQSGTEAWKSKEMRDKAEKASDAAVSSLEVAIGLLPEKDPVRMWAEAGAKAHKLLGKGAILAWREQEVKGRTSDEIRADRVMTAVEMLAVVSPPVAIGLAAGSEVTDWRLRKYYIEPAMDDVRAALSLNFDAESSLRRNIDRARSFKEEEERIINAYEASPRRAANNLRSR